MCLLNLSGFLIKKYSLILQTLVRVAGRDVWVSVPVSHTYALCLSRETDFGNFYALIFDQQWSCSAVNGFCIWRKVFRCVIKVKHKLRSCFSQLREGVGSLDVSLVELVEDLS